jgi:signal transduction histidine kinase
MLRTTLYRRVILIALSAAAIVAIGIGFFAASFYRSSIVEEKDSAFEDIQSRLDLAMTMLEAPEAGMLRKGREALVALAKEHGDCAELATWSQDRLKAKARELGVDDIYVIDSRRIIVATSFSVDLGLNFSKFDRDFIAFLDEVWGKGRVYDQSFSIATRTGDFKTFQYLSPAGSDYTVEVSSNIERSFAEAHSGLAYSGFMDLLFRPFFNRREGRTIRKLDVVFQDGGSYWSLVRPGEKRNLDPALIEKAARDGESVGRSGNLAYCYRPADYGNQGGNYISPVLAEVVVDYSSLQSFGLLSFFISLAACAAAGILSLATARSFFDRSIVARVESLQAAMDKVAGGERGVSFDIEGDDELSSIGKAIETMLAEVRATEESLRNARTAEALGLMAGGLAHDINNLLTGAVGAASLLRNRLEEEGSVPPDEIRSSLKLIESTGEKGEILVRDLLALARSDKTARKPVDLKVLASETAELLKASAPPSVKVALELPEGEAFVLGAAEDLRRVLLNLCRNGMQAMTDMCPPEVRRGGRLDIRLASPESGPEDGEAAAGQAWWAVSISDEGVGIPPEVQQKLFTPFFTTKPRRGGSGLGLSASKAIMEAHGGRIEIAPGKDKGTVFTMLLPALTPGSAPGKPPASSCGA